MSLGKINSMDKKRGKLLKRICIKCKSAFKSNFEEQQNVEKCKKPELNHLYLLRLGQVDLCFNSKASVLLTDLETFCNGG